MLVDFADADRGLFARIFDVCVIGAGPAGMTLARKLAAGGYSVALMEGGGLVPQSISQDLYRGESIGEYTNPPEIVRLREFGGSSGHWGGRCRELDAMNFEPVAHHAFGAWPIAKSDLDLFIAETDEILELVPTVGDLPLEQKTERFRRVEFRLSPPTRFAERYEDEIRASAQILCALNANLVDLRLDEADRSTITGARFRSYDPTDPGLTIEARVYCLCLGALENPRMLLNCASQKPAGIGNAHDLVGRFFSDHQNYRVGDVFYKRPLSTSAFAPGVESCLAPTRAFMESHEVLSFAMVIFPVIEDHLRLDKELARAAACVTPSTAALVERFGGESVDCDRGGLANYFAQGEGKVITHGRLRIRAEEALVADSRVLLGDELDRFGQRRLLLDWRISDLDAHTVRVATLEFAAHFAEQDLGRVRMIDWVTEGGGKMPPLVPGQYVGGPHQMCTTRMAADPREGVVDADCRVHETTNLYIGGSSVFSSTGYASPTYTIVQLALRLADHLNGVLATSAAADSAVKKT